MAKSTKKRGKLKEKLLNKYRLVVLNEETYEEQLYFRLTRLNVMMISILVISIFEASSSSSFVAFLNSLIPLPRPRINSGIFLPPKSNKTTRTMRIIWGPPIIPKKTTKLIISLIFNKCKKNYCRESVFWSGKAVIFNQGFLYICARSWEKNQKKEEN